MHVELLKVALCLGEFLLQLLVLLLQQVSLALQPLDLRLQRLQLVLLLDMLLLDQPQLLLFLDGLLLQRGDPLEGTLALVAPVHKGLRGDLHDGRLDLLLVALHVAELVLQHPVLADVEVQAHVFLLEDLILDLLLVDLLEDLLDVVLGLLEDTLLLHVLNVHCLNLHADFTQLGVSLTHFADDVFGGDLVVAGK